MEVHCGEKILTYDVQGVPLESSEDRILVEEDDDLTSSADWKRSGFIVCPLFTPKEFKTFHDGLTDLLKRFIRESGVSVPIQFALEDYHKYIGDDYNLHLQVIDRTKLILEKYFPIPFDLIEQRISAMCGVAVQSEKPHNGERVFHFRIIRPGAGDYNPLHKDVWQAENRDAINIYVPLVGSTRHSSLLLAEGSHLIPENAFKRTREGALMNGVQFNVPGLIECDVDLRFVRPNPQWNEVLVFSPYLIHGGAINLNTDQTRVSLEMRFWRK